MSPRAARCRTVAVVRLDGLDRVVARLRRGRRRRGQRSRSVATSRLARFLAQRIERREPAAELLRRLPGDFCQPSSRRPIGEHVVAREDRAARGSRASCRRRRRRTRPRDGDRDPAARRGVRPRQPAEVPRVTRRSAVARDRRGRRARRRCRAGSASRPSRRRHRVARRRCPRPSRLPGCTGVRRRRRPGSRSLGCQVADGSLNRGVGSNDSQPYPWKGTSTHAWYCLSVTAQLCWPAGVALGEPERDAGGDVEGPEHHRGEAGELLAEALLRVEESDERRAVIPVVHVERVAEVAVAQVAEDRHDLLIRRHGVRGPRHGGLLDLRRDASRQRDLGRVVVHRRPHRGAPRDARPGAPR